MATRAAPYAVARGLNTSARHLQTLRLTEQGVSPNLLMLKTTFNFIAAPGRVIRLALLVAAALLGAERPAAAEAQVFFTHRSLLASFFPASERVAFRRLDLDTEARARLGRRLGGALRKASYTIFVATTGPHVDGYALIDDEPGQHEAITFGVRLSPTGVVERQEILVYREPRGDEVRADRFRRQFVGKSARDAIAVNVDVDAISGATISSRAMATGVRRAVLLLDELLHPARAGVAASAAAR